MAKEKMDEHLIPLCQLINHLLESGTQSNYERLMVLTALLGWELVNSVPVDGVSKEEAITATLEGVRFMALSRTTPLSTPPSTVQ